METTMVGEAVAVLLGVVEVPLDTCAPGLPPPSAASSQRQRRRDSRKKPDVVHVLRPLLTLFSVPQTGPKSSWV